MMRSWPTKERPTPVTKIFPFLSARIKCEGVCQRTRRSLFKSESKHNFLNAIFGQIRQAAVELNFHTFFFLLCCPLKKANCYIRTHTKNHDLRRGGTAETLPVEGPFCSMVVPVALIHAPHNECIEHSPVPEQWHVSKCSCARTCAWVGLI